MINDLRHILKNIESIESIASQHPPANFPGLAEDLRYCKSIIDLYVTIGSHLVTVNRARKTFAGKMSWWLRIYIGCYEKQFDFAFSKLPGLVEFKSVFDGLDFHRDSIITLNGSFSILFDFLDQNRRHYLDTAKQVRMYLVDKDLDKVERLLTKKLIPFN